MRKCGTSFISRFPCEIFLECFFWRDVYVIPFWPFKVNSSSPSVIFGGVAKTNWVIMDNFCRDGHGSLICSNWCLVYTFSVCYYI